MSKRFLPPKGLRETADKLGGVNQKIANHYGVHRDVSRRWLKEIGYKYNKNNGVTENDSLEKVFNKIYESIS